MVRRLYEEDSSVEDFEDYPRYRTPRLHGGQGTSGRQDGIARTETTSETEKEFPQTLQKKYSTNKSFIDDKVKFITDLCDSHHLFEPASGLRLPHRCRACNSGRTMTLYQCTQCKMFVHPECKEVTNNKTPLPCIPATPIRNLRKPDLRECLAGLPPNTPKVPAILTKCFHELQKRDRIICPNIYVPLSQAENLELIEKWSTKLRRHVNRNLDEVPTRVLSGCVLKFLFDIRDQIITDEENRQFRVFDFRFFELEEELVPQRAGQFLKRLDDYRLQTLAATFMHIRNLYVHRERNDLNSQRVIDAFGEIFQNVKTLFHIPPKFWLRSLCLEPKRQRLPKLVHERPSTVSDE